MRKIGLRELHRRTGDLVKQLEKGGEPFVITKHGRPVGVLFPCAMDAPERPIVDFEPPLPMPPQGLQRQVFQLMDAGDQVVERIARKIGVDWHEVAIAMSRLEIGGYVRRGTVGHTLSPKGAALAEWIRVFGGED